MPESKNDKIDAYLDMDDADKRIHEQEDRRRNEYYSYLLRRQNSILGRIKSFFRGLAIGYRAFKDRDSYDD